MRRQAVSAVLAVVVLGLGVSPVGAAEGPDLSLGMKGPTGTPGLGASFDVIVTVTNIGNATASAATLGLYFGDSLRVDAVSSTDPTDSCDEPYPGERQCDLGDMAPGAVSSFRFEVTRMMSREVWADAWTGTTADESNLRNNFDGIHLEADQSTEADVAVKGSAPKNPDIGQDYETTFTVSNRGPDRAQDVRLIISLPEKNTFVSAVSSDPTDTCTLHEEKYDEEGLEGGPYIYRSVRCDLGSMAFAREAVITVTQKRDNAYELWTSGYVRTATYDWNWDNDWVELFTGGHPSVTSDLSVTHTVSEETPLVGSDFDVTFTLTNGGPVPAPETVFSTYVPDTFELRSITAAGDHPCTQDRWGGIQCDLGTMEVGESETVALAITRTRARETWLYGYLDSPNYDPTYENDYVEFMVAPDTSDPADVAVKVEGPVDPAVGSSFTTTATVTNNGPNTARSVEFHNSISDWSTFVSVTSSDPSDSCELIEETYDDEGAVVEGADEVYVYREVNCDLGDLEKGESATIEVTMTRDEEFHLWTNSWIETASYDENFDNDWAEWNSTGDYDHGDCYESEAGKVVACDYSGESGAANGSISFKAGTRRDSTVSSGEGDDKVTIHVPIGGERERRIVVLAGRGDDNITVNVAPGARNVVIVVRAGSGNDTVDVDAPRTREGVKIVVKGGSGRDLLLGSQHADLMWGGKGRDRLEGAEGNDRLAGGLGRDTCIGGTGRDRRIGC